MLCPWPLRLLKPSLVSKALFALWPRLLLLLPEEEKEQQHEELLRRVSTALRLPSRAPVAAVKCPFLLKKLHHIDHWHSQNNKIQKKSTDPKQAALDVLSLSENSGERSPSWEALP